MALNLKKITWFSFAEVSRKAAFHCSASFLPSSGVMALKQLSKEMYQVESFQGIGFHLQSHSLTNYNETDTHLSIRKSVLFPTKTSGKLKKYRIFITDRYFRFHGFLRTFITQWRMWKFYLWILTSFFQSYLEASHV